jgi:hypothetical protein
MVALRDYIGLILSDIQNARVQGDIEALRIGELYSKNKTLRSFPIPRVRLQNVEIFTPVAIDMKNESIIEEYKKPYNLREIQDNAYQTIEMQVQKEGINLSSTEIAVLKKAIDSKIKLLYPNREEQQGVPATDIYRITEELTTEVHLQLKKMSATNSTLKSIDLDNLILNLKNDLTFRIVNLRPTSPSLQVLINSSQIKEAGPKEVITTLRFSIVEEGMEWVEYQSEKGEIKEKMVPE